MTSPQIEELIRQLRDSNENNRLKAANFLSKNKPPDAGATIPALKEIFLGDPNPAVRFLAKKALSNLGENVDAVKIHASAAAQPAAADPDQTAREADLLWKVASDELKPVVPSLFRLVDSTEDRVLEQVSEAIEGLGTVMCAAPLLEAFEREQTRVLTSEEGALATYDDVKELIHIAKLKHSGINPSTAAAMGNLSCPEVLEAFIDMLRSGNRVLQNNAVRILAELCHPDTIDPLLKLLGGDNARLESKVIKTVSKIARESKQAQEVVINAVMGHFRVGESEFKLYSIVEALGRIGHPKALPFLVACLRHNLPRVRANAVEGLARMELPEDEKIRLLGPMLNDENNRVLANAVAALWHTAAKERARAVCDQAVAHPDKWHRASIAFALGQMDAPESVQPLVALMKDSDADVRRNAQNALQKLSSKGAISKLVEFINDENLDVRVKVIDQIGKSGITAYNDVLHLLMIDAEAYPRLLATLVLALGRMQLVENIPTISYYLNDRDERIRANAVEALEAINDQKVMSLISLAVSDTNSRVKANAAKALWRFGELTTVQTVRKMIESPAVDMQASGAYALGDMAAAVRDKNRLATHPLLASALRRHPRYEQLRSQSA